MRYLYGKTKSWVIRSALGIIVIVLFLCPVIVDAAIFYVSINGKRTFGASTPGDWSTNNCYGTISAAIENMSGGDEVVVDDGTYVGMPNSISGVPSGNSYYYTVIRARNPFKVTIDSGSGTDPQWDYWGRLIGLSGHHIEVDGFKLRNRDGSNNEANTISGDYIIMRRCLVRIEAPMNKEMYALSIASGASYILVEDCGFVGGFRYMIGIRCAGGSASHIVFRRVVARGDWTNTGDPYSVFAVYGNNSSAANGPHHIVYQNCIAIDSNPIRGSNTYKHVPWYIFKGNHDIALDGCITLNNAVVYYYFFRNDYGGYNLEIKNSVFWDNDGTTTTGYFRGSDSSSGYNRIWGCTFGDQPRGFTTSMNGSQGYIKNNLFVDLSNASMTFGGSSPSRSYNSFDNSGQEFGSDIVPYNNDLKYICRVESDSNRYNGGNGGHVGAHLVKKLGVSGTLYGESGWDTETDEELWPWPYEEEIRNWFRATNNPPAGASPSSNNTKRGFCADGQTLTKYIWEYLGYPIPPEIDDGGPNPPSPPDTNPPFPPTGLQIIE